MTEHVEDSAQAPLLLGIDTGGTYTDAVLYSEDEGIQATAKSLTTRHDLAIGVSGAISGVLGSEAAHRHPVSLVSLSTTLATNALVEGQGGRVGLVMIGFDEADLHRSGLAEALGDDPVIFLKGGHDVYGRESALDLAPLEPWLKTLGGGISAIAVVGYFAVRNPAHENAARDEIAAATGLPVTCSHELTSRLGGPRRALTTVLNARLVPMISRLIHATQTSLATHDIRAPMMVVRGDGALISSEEALMRPIETILSGPAASIVGARHLSGLDNAVVSDIGGTTTDVAVLENGFPRLDEGGASVGGYRTMVEAVAMHTYGLGGDSEVHLVEEGVRRRLRLGPRRLMPLSLAAHLAPEPVFLALERQLRPANPGRLDGRFAFRTGLPDHFAANLPAHEQTMYQRLTELPQPIDKLLTGPVQRATLDRLAARGLAQIAGFTPSDAMHILHRQDQWNREAAEMGAELFARRKDGAGARMAPDATALAEAVSAQMTRQSSEVILASLLAEEGSEGMGPEPATSPMMARALARTPGLVQFSVSIDRPLIGLGASAPVHYPAIAQMLGAQSVIPEHAGVANALGAVVGQIRETAIVFVNVPEEGVFLVNDEAETHQFAEREAAFAFARALADRQALELAARSGADRPTLTRKEIVKAPLIEGREKLIEARFISTATGRPRISR